MDLKNDPLIFALFSKALSIIPNSYSPYSKCKVSAAVLAESELIYGGVNVENCSFGVTLCAERVAICNAIASGEKKIKAILVLTDAEAPWTPCGVCRQTILEFALKNIPIYMANKSGVQSVASIGELLPLAFSPEKLSTFSI